MAINGVTGEFDFFPPSEEEAASIARNETPAVGLLKAAGPTLGGLEDDLADDYTRAGWAVVYCSQEPEPVRRILHRLFEHRLSQFPEKRRNRCRMLTYSPGDTKSSWLLNHGADPADVNPNRVPYYLLIVGSPAAIPFSFTQDLSLSYAVGRLFFPTAEQYALYVDTLIDYETSTAVRRLKEAAFFATRHSGDRATELSHDTLIEPLLDGDTEEDPVTEASSFTATRVLEAAATHPALFKMFASESSFLMTATQGLAFNAGHPRQIEEQGSLYCADRAAFSAADLPAESLQGLITFHFACYSAGTPSLDNFIRDSDGAAPVVAPEPFFARLPQAELSHSAGASLAAIGHIDRCWGWSFINSRQQPALMPFRGLIRRVLGGKPVGRALSNFHHRAAVYTADLQRLRQAELDRQRVRTSEWADAWRYRNEAREYVLLGDTAARLRVDLMRR